MANPLPLEDYQRYGRQMILDGFGLEAQLRLQSASVVVVGAGGLGCPALQYLAASGIGRIGVVDNDTVERSNLQRQILHSEQTVGLSKVDSAIQALRRLNSRTVLEPHHTSLTSSNALSILSKYDIILDCTDNAPTRYLLSDAAVRLRKPLVSGAAQKFEGQLCIYNRPLKGSEERGPCYRCLFPTPPKPETVGSCEEVGILGAVTGVIGTLQALEAIKLITGLHEGPPSLLLYSALSVPPFRHVKLRSRRRDCSACSVEAAGPTPLSSYDYVAFCGGERPNWIERGLISSGNSKRISAKDLHAKLQGSSSSVRLIDVRPPVEFGICHLPNSINVPLRDLISSPSNYLPTTGTSAETVLVCRLGNDSQIAADTLAAATNSDSSASISDLTGGLRSWNRDVDAEFPVY